MTPDDAFLEAILASPADDTPRLVYADWLTDRDDPRGEFIVVQCRLARMDEDDPRRSLLETRERELLDRHQDEWLGRVQSSLSRWTFHRGFLDEVAVPARLLAEPGGFTRPATVRRVEVDLSGCEVPLETIEFVPECVAHENLLFPLARRPGGLLLAMARPDEHETLEKLRFIFNCEIEAFPAPADQILDAIGRHYGQLPQEEVTEFLAEFVDVAIDWPTQTEERAVSQLVNRILLDALTLHADEVRLEPQAEHAVLFFHVGGTTVERGRSPRRLLSPIAARLRVLAGLDPIADQSAEAGHFRLGGAGLLHEFEIAITPTGLGPRILLTV